MSENPSGRSNNEHEPYIPSSTVLPEITVKAVILGITLSMALAAANAYLGLFAGMTVSASIPAAVISMAILRLFKNSNILENNIVQTSASAGESLAAGVIFTIPAMIIMGAWTEFSYLQTTMIAALGGIMGVVFTIPLRRALIVEQPLKFPEGVATAEVLKVGEGGGSGGVKYLAWAGLIGALFKFGDTGLRLWGGVFERATYVGNSLIYFGTNLSPALVGVGFIVGLNIAVLIFIGGALNWMVAIPVIVSTSGIPEGATSAVEAAGRIWSSQTRYFGVGAMVVGGLWALIKLRASVNSAVRSGIKAYKHARDGGEAAERTERDTPMHWVGIIMVITFIPLLFAFSHFTESFTVGAVMTLIMVVAAFLFSAVAGYMAGLVGSSNNPISGVTIATILMSSLLLVTMLGTGSTTGPAAAILIGAVVACAAAIAGDNLQDLKAGRIVGATPIKQQAMQLLGVISAAVVIAPVLTLLLKAYGIGVPTATHPEPLAAPQASLMAAVADGVFNSNLPWDMVIIGMGVAVFFIVLDLFLEKKGSSFRTPVLAVAVGIYLPLELEVAMLIGGLVAWAVAKHHKDAKERSLPEFKEQMDKEKADGERNGLLFSAGLITGEALIGILLAIPIVVVGRADALAFWGDHTDASWPGMILLGIVMVYLYSVGSGMFKQRLE